MSEQQSEDPQFTHDCDQCTFLGRHKEFDLYHCLQGGKMPTVLARWSSNGPDYKSGLPFIVRDPDMAEAWRRADARGLKL